MNKSVLVTGGAGYVGSHTCKALKNAGYTPITYDNLVYGHKDFVKWGQFICGDILDQEKLEKIIRQYNIYSVIHFAAFAYVGESINEPNKYYKNNVTGTISLLEVIKNTGLNRIIFSSTCAIYGIPTYIPITETHPKTPISPYGNTKLMIEKILKDYDTAYSIKNISLRYFNAAGADPSCEIGEDHTPETHLIPKILDVATGKSDNIIIYGNDYESDDGTCVRDYVHVTDLADAHVLALKYLESGNSSTVFNLGNQKGYSVLEIIDTVRKITGKKIKINFGDRRSGDPSVLISSSEKSQQTLEWKPKYSNIETMIDHAWQWYKKRNNI